jgi:hypothetical protein
MTLTTARRDEIIRAVSAGLARGTPLTIICESLQAQGPFAGRSLFNWLRDDPEAKFAIEYARDLGHDWLARECLEIADDTSGDVIHDAEGGERPNGAAVLRARVRIETRLKLLAKWSPRYSEGHTLKVEGDVKVTQRHVIDPASLDDTGRAALRHLIDQAREQGLLAPPEPVDAEYEELPSDEPG